MVNNAVLQLSQSLADGKIDGQTWNSMLNSQMGPTLRAIADMMGITMGELKSGLSDGSIAVDDFIDTLVTLNEEGGGGLESLQQIAQDATGGIQTSIANMRTAVSRGLANMIDAIDKALVAANFPSIGEMISNVGSVIEQAITKASEVVGPLISLLGELFDKVRNSTAFQSFKDVASTAFDTARQAVSDFAQSETWQTIKDTVKDVAQAILDIDFGEVISQVGAFLDKWSPLIIGVIAGIGAFKTITTVMAIVTGVISAVSSVGGILAVVMGALASPVLIVAAVIGALVTAGVWLYKNWDTIKEKAQELGTKISEVWDGIKEWTSQTWETVKTTIVEAVTNIWNSITEWFGGLPTWFREKWDEIVESVTTWVEEMGTKATEAGSRFLENIVTFFSELPYKIGFFLGSVIGSVAQWGLDMWDKAKETGSNFLTSISEFFSQLPGRIRTFLTNAWQNVTTWASNMWSKAKETGSNFITNIVTWFQQLPGRIQTWLSDAIRRVTTWVSNMSTKAQQAGSEFVNKIINWFQQLPGRVGTWLSNVITRASTFVREMGAKAREAGSTFIRDITGTLRELPGKMVSIGGDIVMGLWNGIKGMWDSMTGWVGDLAGGFIDGIKSKFGVKSPSRVFRDEIGKMIVKGFGLGIERNEKDAIRPMQNMLDSVLGVWDSQTSGLGATFRVTGKSDIESAMNRVIPIMPDVNRFIPQFGTANNLQALMVNTNTGSSTASHSIPQKTERNLSINIHAETKEPLDEAELLRRARLEAVRAGYEFQL